MPQMQLGFIVETNCIFSSDKVTPVVSNPLLVGASNLVYRCCVNVDNSYEGIKYKNLDVIDQLFANQPL